MRIDLKAEDPCPEAFRDIEPLHLSLVALRKKFEDILKAEGFTFSDVEAVDLTFHFCDEFPDDYCSICDARVVALGGRKFRHIVDYLGNTRVPNEGRHADCL